MCICLQTNKGQGVVTTSIERSMPNHNAHVAQFGVQTLLVYKGGTAVAAAMLTKLFELDACYRGWVCAAPMAEPPKETRNYRMMEWNFVVAGVQRNQQQE